ncbi:hypothetical protein [Maricaulis sp.]|uniref:hypothetical protein n=1 Tax=Maricaulis sp. TaxID=1486257 RepID=UPI003A91ED20
MKVLRWILRAAIVLWLGWWGLILANPDHPLGLEVFSNRVGAIAFAILSIFVFGGTASLLVQQWRRMLRSK